MLKDSHKRYLTCILLVFSLFFSSLFFVDTISIFVGKDTIFHLLWPLVFLMPVVFCFPPAVSTARGVTICPHPSASKGSRFRIFLI